MFLYKVRTTSTVQWTAAIAQNAAVNANIAVPAGLSGMNGQVECILRGLTIVSKEQLAWELAFYTSDLFAGSSIDTDTYIGSWAFAASGTAGDGEQIAATGDFLYYIDGLEIPLWDTDLDVITAGLDATAGSGELHVRLVNRSAAAKTANAAGAIAVTFWLEPMQAGGGGA